MKKKKQALSVECYDLENQESDEYFYYIAGYTPNGAPFGITWEQAIEEGLVESDTIHDSNDLPF